MERYVCIHGHFYQPPRENPWLEAVEVQDSAAPYHDWNERITRECYAPNTRSRLVDPEGKIVHLLNNYAAMSFNFGHRRAVPYFTIGAGAARLDPHVAGTNAKTETRFTATFGAGVKAFFTPNVGMRFEGRYYGTSLPDSDRGSCDRRFDRCDNRNWLSNGDVTGGLIFAF